MKILIVDDSPTLRGLLKRELESLGHECLVAEDGAQGWETFQGSGVDVVISAWTMPGMDGDELCSRVRSATSVPYAYFILLTSPTDRKHVLACLEAGADDYLTEPFDEEGLAARLLVAERVTALHRTLAAKQAELRHLNASLLADSLRDSLTGLGNRRRQDEDLRTLVGRAERYGYHFSVALFDIDRFKAYNDSAGYLAGDRVLLTIATALSRQCRSGDSVYRHGGEELLAVLPHQTLETGAIAAERMRDLIESLAIPHVGLGAGERVTVSAGIACFEPGRGDELDMLLKRADFALRTAKEAGRNKVVARERAPDRAA